MMLEDIDQDNRKEEPYISDYSDEKSFVLDARSLDSLSSQNSFMNHSFDVSETDSSLIIFSFHFFNYF